jgi:tetratricopeptide (TPR) repeat protein
MLACAESKWTVARDSHFEVFSQTTEPEARAAVVWLERLRTFFIQTRISSLHRNGNGRGPVRVIQFTSRQDYATVQPSQSADAFFLASPARDYVILSSPASLQSGILAHEYAHLVLHSLGIKLPIWFAEGVAEFFSTLHITDRECTIGGDLPVRRAALKHDWVPLGMLFSVDSAARLNRRQADVFYAESWALADMLIASPEYAARAPALIAELATGTDAQVLLRRIYGKSLETVEAELQTWLTQPKAALTLPSVSPEAEYVTTAAVSEFERNLLMADFLLASGRVTEAEQAYRELERDNKHSAPVYSALALIELQRGNREEARVQWARALELGVTDAAICFRYAELSEDANAPGSDVRAALVQALDLAPAFDDARYKLALLEYRVGNYPESVKHLRMVASVPPERAYGYWTAMANALVELSERDEAKSAARKAMENASNDRDRSAASLLSYMAATDLTVQLARDEKGNLQVVTARKPHGSDDWNPFVEAGDQIRHFSGKIRKVECTANKITGFEVASEAQSVQVALPDPSHVLITGGTPEFVCGAEDGRTVAIDFAVGNPQTGSGGILRGMRFQ